MDMISKEHPELSLVIPCFNEAERISSSLDKALAYFAGVDYSYEILVVDDGSRDDTVKVVSHYSNERIRIVEQGVNKGKGSVVRLGMLQAKGQYRVFTDADFSTPIDELPKLIDSLKSGADICIGSRRLDRSLVKQHQPWYRELIGVIGNKIISLLLISGIEDTQCGFKGLTENATKALFPMMKIDGFGFDVELLYLAKRMEFSVKQVPVLWYNDERSRLNPIRDSIRTFSEILRIRKIHG